MAAEEQQPAAAPGGPAAPSSEETPEAELARADAMHQEALKLLDKDPEEAVDLLGQVLEARNKHHGEMGVQCLEAYLWYGRALLEQARMSTDAMGNSRSHLTAKKQRDSKGEPAAAAAGGGSGAAGAAATGEQPGKKQGPDAAEEGGAAEGQEQEGGDDEDDNEEEEQEGDGEEEGEEGDGGSDDLQLAWEMLEVARLIAVQNNDASGKYDSLLAEVHLALGDLSAEKEDFTQALDEYLHCRTLLEGTPAPDKRRLAEAHFNTMLVLMMDDRLNEALEHCNRAVALLRARRGEVMEQLDTPVEGELEEEADAAIEALERQVEQIDAALADLKERREDLQASIEQQVSFKNVLTAFLKNQAGGAATAEPAAGAGAAGSSSGHAAAAAGSSGAGGSGSGSSSDPWAAAAAGLAAAATGAGGGAAPPSAAAPAKNLGVVGRGRARITLQPVQPANGAAPAPAGGIGGGGGGPAGGGGAAKKPAPAAAVAVAAVGAQGVKRSASGGSLPAGAQPGGDAGEPGASKLADGVSGTPAKRPKADGGGEGGLTAAAHGGAENGPAVPQVAQES